MITTEKQKKSKEYYQENKLLILKKRKEYAIKNKSSIQKKRKENYEKNKLLKHKYKKEYYEKNKLLIQKTSKEYYEKNKLLKQKKSKEYYQENKLLILKKRKENKKRVNKKSNIYIKKRRAEDISFRILSNIRSRVRGALKRNSKSSKTFDLLGCDIAFLKQYLESKFKDGMCWENYGFKVWHIDHIKPCSLFDFKNIEDQKQCFHYTNLQPLSAIDNLIKGKKWESVL